MTEKGTVKATGRSVGNRISQGMHVSCLILKICKQSSRREILVTEMTDPDWNHHADCRWYCYNRGGRTCHAAIIAREHGIPAIVGCGDATATIKDGDEITVSCAEGETGLCL